MYCHPELNSGSFLKIFNQFCSDSIQAGIGKTKVHLTVTPGCASYSVPVENAGNQFIPLGIETTLQERVRIAAEFDSYCNGGSILHANIDAPFDSYEKARKMVEYIADAGVTYFAFNPKIQACRHDHAFYGSKCPVCGEDVASEFTRIVGFFTKTSTWSKNRKSEYHMRKWIDMNKESEAV